MNGTELTLATDDLHWLTKDQAWHYRILPKNKNAKTITLYCDPAKATDALASELEVLLGNAVCFEPIPETQITRLLSKYYLKDHTDHSAASLEDHQADSFLAGLIMEARNL